MLPFTILNFNDEEIENENLLISNTVNNNISENPLRTPSYIENESSQDIENYLNHTSDYEDNNKNNNNSNNNNKYSINNK